MDLVPYMYFERQEAGSQLCAQHCLNNILQQKTYTEFDLADIAQRLDQAENAELSTLKQNKKSYNLDDTGFFSISVLERALQVWDLTLVRWRGEAMKPYQDRPEDQTAFILHLAQHWLPLRRFAPNPPHAAAPKRWYNLNSFSKEPEWISPTYLKMVLTAAEQEGYSVFVVRRAGHGPAGAGADMPEGEGWGDGGIGRMPECLADNMAVDLGEPVSRSGGAGTVSPAAGGMNAANSDRPTVDPSSIAGPSSPPRARRRRQQDLSSDDIVQDPFLPQGGASGFAQSGKPKGFAPAEDIDSDEDEHIPDSTAYGQQGASDFTYDARHYDDEDAALQAALRASMEDVPSGWEMPDLSKKKSEVKRETKVPRDLPIPPPVLPQQQPTQPASPNPPAQSATAQNWRVAGNGPAQRPPQATPDKSTKREEATEAGQSSSAPLSPAEELSPDEIRRRRLAKFAQ